MRKKCRVNFLKLRVRNSTILITKEENCQVSNQEKRSFFFFKLKHMYKNILYVDTKKHLL